MNINKNPFLCHSDEECSKVININPDIAGQLSSKEIQFFIEDTFKIERAENGVLKR